MREQAREYTARFGQQLVKEGYRGYFELDFLIDQNTRNIYLGELNPRITGASSMTNHAAFAHADAPLFLFHLLEFSGVPFDLDIDELNARWAEPENIDSWSQLVIKHTEDSVDLLTAAPDSGIWRMRKDGCIDFDRFDYHRRAVESEKEAFFLRILQPGDYRYEGADLGILVTRGRLMDDKFKLTRKGEEVDRRHPQYYAATPITAAAAPARGAGVQDALMAGPGGWSRLSTDTQVTRPSNNLTFTAIDESLAGREVGRLFRRLWPAYERWWLSEGELARPSYLDCRNAIRDHMPEMLALYDELTELAGGGDQAARFLSGYCPPPYLAGCSQAVWGGEEPLLVRNYDYSPRAFDAVVLRTEWLGRRMLGVSDSLIGLLDGINDDGLAVSLTFGGRRVVGKGFGIPIVLRYILQTCATVAEATKVLQRIPCHMAYNVTLLDRSNQHKTVFVSPDRPATVTDSAVATNHQHEVEWSDHARRPHPWNAKSFCCSA